MKFAIPEISWHNRDPVLSVDFQPKCENGPMRLASGGTDSHVLIWYVSVGGTGSVNLEVAADLMRHQKAVNVVRWSPSGQLLGSGDDESIIFVWKQKTEEPPIANFNGEEQYKESWVIYKTLRGHMEDVMDISWSSNSLHLASGSVDNKLIVWDINKGKYTSILTDHKGFVQGVAWDPKGQIIVSTSSDRVFRAFDAKTKKVISRSSKSSLPFPADHPFHGVKLRLYHDDTLQTYFRRLHFSPDGMLVSVPAGRIEPEQGRMDTKPLEACYIYTRYDLKVPAGVSPCTEPALVTRWSPKLYELRPDGPPPVFPFKYRMVLAVATKTSVWLYDTQQHHPIALITNIHYTRMTDLTWSPDGCTLVVSSTDGYCSIIMFAEGEIGTVLSDAPESIQEPTEKQSEELNESTAAEKTEAGKPVECTQTEKLAEETAAEPLVKTAAPTTPKINEYIKFKNPNQKSPTKQKVTNVADKTPVKKDLLEDSAMPSWNDDSNNEFTKPRAQGTTPPKSVDSMNVDETEDLNLVYEDTQSQSPKEKLAIETDPAADKTQDRANIQDTIQPTTATEQDQPPVPEQAKNPVQEASPPRETPTPAVSTDTFLQQAKVTDIAESAVRSAPSPKAPRRVSFVTLSSPKSSKKK